jgi:hypothetical protein
METININICNRTINLIIRDITKDRDMSFIPVVTEKLDTILDLSGKYAPVFIDDLNNITTWHTYIRDSSQEAEEIAAVLDETEKEAAKVLGEQEKKVEVKDLSNVELWVEGVQPVNINGIDIYLGYLRIENIKH